MLLGKPRIMPFICRTIVVHTDGKTRSFSPTMEQASTMSAACISWIYSTRESSER